MRAPRSSRTLALSAAAAAAVLGLSACSSSGGSGTVSGASAIPSEASSALQSALPSPSSSASAMTSASAMPSASASSSAGGGAGGTSIQSLTGVNTTITLSPSIVQVLQTAGVNVTSTGPGQGSLSGNTASFTFPVTGGSVDLGSGSPSGTIKHQGGLTFSAGGKSVTAKDFYIQLPGGQVTADVNGVRAPLFQLDLSQANISPSGGTVTLSGIPVSLPEGGASALNGALGTSLPSVTLGTATSTLKG